ncbi:MAG: DedA family protein [Holosporaceae bacterium]|nr:DedA family protein [Holosporaceae bacterium]
MFEHFIESYGYCAVFLFACIEGELAVLTAGFLCQRGLMALHFVMLAAFLGTLITEQCLFFVGRRYGLKLLKRYPTLSEKSDKVIKFLKKYDSSFIFGSRFIYGIRNISPIVIGMAEITPFRFSSLNIPAAMIWSVAVAGAGYIFADFLEVARNNLQYLQVAALIIFCGALLYFIRKKTST